MGVRGPSGEWDSTHEALQTKYLSDGVVFPHPHLTSSMTETSVGEGRQGCFILGDFANEVSVYKHPISKGSVAKMLLGKDRQVCPCLPSGLFLSCPFHRELGSLPGIGSECTIAPRSSFGIGTIAASKHPYFP